MTDIDVILQPDGSVRLNATNGTFADGAEKLMALVGKLQAMGIPVEVTGQPEQHRDDDHTHVGVGAHQHA